MMRLFAGAGIAVAAMLLCVGGGCDVWRSQVTGREISFRQPGGQTWQALSFDRALYAMHGMHHADILLINGPDDDPTLIVHMRMFYQPIGGQTPQDDSSTNCTVRALIVSADDEAAIFGGGGFLFNYSDLDGDSASFGLRETSMRVLDATDGFEKPDAPVTLLGDFSADRDDEAVTRLLREVQNTVRRKLGYPRVVEADARKHDG